MLNNNSSPQKKTNVPLNSNLSQTNETSTSTLFPNTSSSPTTSSPTNISINDSRSVAVLIPCYNEELTIGKVVSDFQRVLPHADIYVYNNNSTDNTEKIAREHGAIVRNVPLKGKGNVVRAMFRDIIADVYVLVDGDDTYPAESAPALIQKVYEGYNMVCGDRLSTTYFTENKRAFHNFGNQLVRSLINLSFAAHIHDIMTGYRAMSFSFVKSFATLSAGFELETEMAIFCLNNRITFCEVPVKYRDRPSGSESKLNTISDGFKVITTIALMIRDCRPLAFFGIIGLILAIIGLGIMIPIFIAFGQTGVVLRFPTVIAGSFIILTGILSLIAGIILNSIAQKNQREVVLTANKVALDKAILDNEKLILNKLNK